MIKMETIQKGRFFMKILALDFGGTAIKYGLWEDRDLSHLGSFATPTNWDAMKQTLKELAKSFSDLEGVAISAPGSVDVKAGIIGGISAIPYIHHFPIGNELEELFGVPVTIENDANCAALAEMQYGVAQHKRSTAFFIIGSGIGGAIAINGELVKGAHLFGGEFGYMLMDEKRTLSQLTSPVQWAEKYNREHPSEQPLSGKSIFDLADKGNTEALHYVGEWYQTLARGMANVCLVIDPEQIAIGGGISQRKEILAPIKEELNKILKQNGASELTVEVVFCEFEQQANLIGAVANFERMKG